MEVSMELKQRYMRSILGQLPFACTYTILDSREVAFATLSTESATTLRKLEHALQDNEDKLCTLRTLWHIDGVVGWDMLESIVQALHKDPSTFDMVYPTLSSEVTEVLWGLYKDFVETLAELRSEVTNKDFWQGAG